MSFSDGKLTVISQLATHWADGRHGQRGGPDPVRELLPEQHPDHRPPRHAEGDDEDVGGDEGDGALRPSRQA